MPDTITTEKLTLTLVSNEHLKGKFRYKGKKYYIRAKQMSSGQFYTAAESLTIRVDERKNIPNPNYRKVDVFHLNDTVRTAKNIFIIQSISPFLNKIVLTPGPLGTGR